jgi:phage-related tail fiber protein
MPRFFKLRIPGNSNGNFDPNRTLDYKLTPSGYVSITSETADVAAGDMIVPGSKSNLRRIDAVESNVTKLFTLLKTTSLTDNDGLLATLTAASATKLAIARTIAVGGDINGSTTFDGTATASLTATLANSGATAGTYTKVAVDAKGRVTVGAQLVSSDVTTALGFTPISANQSITLTGDATGLGSTAITVTLANSGATAGTYTKLTINAKGLVTSATTLAASDIPSLDATKITTGTLSVPTTGSAASLTTARALALSGDATGSVSFDGSANATISATLANSGVSAGTYSFSTIVLDAKGRVTFAANGIGGVSGTATSLVKIDDISASFNGSTATFNLRVNSATATPISPNYLMISINGVMQEPTAAYTVSGSTITFTEAPAAGSTFYGVLLTDISVNTVAVTLTGDVTGSGAGTFTTALSNSGVIAGTYNSVVVNAKGIVTSASSIGYLTSESDTFATVTGRGAATSSAISITNSTASSGTGTGALIVTGGVGVGGNLNIGGNLALTGDLVINGTTTTVNATTVTIDDPILTLGGDTAPTMDDNKDRGIEFRWHNGTTAKVGFFGFKDSTGYLTFIPDATNTSEVFAGTTGTIAAALIGNAITATALQTARTIAISGDATGSVSFDGSANTTISATLANSGVTAGTYSKVIVDAKGRVTGATYLVNDDLPLLDANRIQSGTLYVPSASSAAFLTTARTIALSGDATGSVSFDGRDNVTITTTLANTSAISGSYGSGSAIPVIIVDSKGRVFSISTTPITASTTTLTGDATGTGAGTVSVTLANSGVTAGTYSALAVDAKGRVTTGINITTTGDATGTASGSSIALTLANSGVVSGSGYTKFNVDAKGRVTYGTTLVAADIPSLDATKITTGTLSVPTTGSAASLTTARTIAIAGDASGSVSFDGTTNATISATLANSGVAAGTYSALAVDAKGRVTTGINMTATGDATGTASGSSIALTLANSGATAGTFTKVTINTKGLVTSATTLDASDIPSLDATKITTGTLSVATTSSAASLTTARTIALSGDASGSVSFNGTADITITSTLANSGVVAGTYNSVVVNAKGLVISASTASTTASDTLATVTGRGATTSSAISITSSTASSGTGSGALIVTGGVGIGGNLNIGGDLSLTGNLTINGTTTTVNSTTVTLDDPILTLGGDTAPTMDDNKDRGIEFRWHNGTTAKVGFFGFKDSTGYLTFIPDATNTSEVFAGTTGTISAALIGNASTATALQTARTIAISGDSTGSVSFDGSANATISATLANSGATAGTYTKVTINAKGLVTTATTLSAADIPSHDATKITTGTLSVPTTGSAASLTTARTIAISGDASGSVSFDGSANATISATLANSGAVAGTYAVSTVVIDSKGRVTSASSGLSTQVGIAAAGLSQAAATGLTVALNVISTSTAGSATGVRLMTASTGLLVYVINESANAITVYPATGGTIDSLAVNAGFSLGSGGRLTFVATSATKWYSMTAVYG